MKILAFETSCDDTSIALFEDNALLSLSTLSQLKVHEATGWVVPEVAAREHANNIFQAIDNAFSTVDFSLHDIDYIAVSTKPGLLPSLLTGVSVASTFSILLEKPIIEVHHIEAHVFANFLERKEEEIVFPLVCLTVSGGHTDIYYMKDMWSFEKVAGTGDDAAGEAYDKVAKMMGLGYPGWPVISQYAENFYKKWWVVKNLFPYVMLEKDSLDFSFSGLKSSVKREVDKRKDLWSFTESDREEIAASFQEAINEVLARKLILAANKYNVSTFLLAGWVSANDNLNEKLRRYNKNEKIFLSPTKKIYSMDNAAMIGILAYYKIKYKREAFVPKIISI